MERSERGRRRFPVNLAAIVVMAVVAIAGVAVLETATPAGEISNLTLQGGKINCVNEAKGLGDLALSSCMDCCAANYDSDAQARCKSQCVKNFDDTSQFPGGGGGKAECHKDSDCAIGEVCVNEGQGVRKCQLP
jgi:hypothetical protein